MRCYDLSLTEAQPEPQTQRDRLASAIKLGYHGGAVVHQAEAKLQPRDRCGILQVEPGSLLTAQAGVDQALRRAQPSNHKQPPATASAAFRQLTRLSFPAEEPTAAQACCSSAGIVGSYDVLAVQPRTPEAFAAACTSMEVDVVSLDLAHRLPYRLRPALIKAALTRGVFFEICYGPALRDPGSRRQLMANAQALCRVTRGRGLIVSSAARSSSELRAPHDVINLATFFGLTWTQAQSAIGKNVESVMQHALSRRAYRGVIIVQETAMSVD